MNAHVDPVNPTTDESTRRAEALTARLTLDQKLAQVSCYFARDMGENPGLDEEFPHGVGHISMLEARTAVTLDEAADFVRRAQTRAMEASGHGIPAMLHMEGLCGAYLPGATSFPSGIGRGSSWDPELERRIGEIVGRQERALGITLTLAPVLDLARDPRLGRVGESYGEDPTLVAAMGAALTVGLQGRDADGRQTDAVAKHFLGSHQVGGGIHGADVNVSERSLVEDIGKPFRSAIARAGLRGIMPSYNSVNGEPVTASTRLLQDLLRGDLGFDGIVVSDYCAIQNLHTVQKVAASPGEAGVAALRAGVDAELHVPYGYADGLRDLIETGRADVALLDRAVTHVLAAKYRMGLFDNPFPLDAPERDARFTEARDRDIAVQSARESIVLLKNDDAALPLSRDAKKVAVIGCHAATARYFFGGYTHYSMAEGLFAARKSMAGLTDQGEEQTVDLVPGTSVEASDQPEYETLLTQHQPGIRSLLEELTERLPGARVTWAYGYPIAGADDSHHDEALAVARDADVVILTLGGKHGTSSIVTTGEGVDTTDINLPACQETLIEKLAGLGTPLVGVHLDGRPISSDAADRHLDAIVEAWNPAEGAATAIVDTLLGDSNPSGKLPVTVARNAGQLPIHYRHVNGSNWHQGESIGFPDYVDQPHTPRYHFGHGLSYTTFEYADLELSSHDLDPDASVRVACTVTNTGTVDGTEIVQLYVRDRYASVSRPVMELAGFQRVRLAPGGSATVTFDLAATQLAFLDAGMRWLVEAGDVDVLLGSSSADIRLTDAIRITADRHVASHDVAQLATSASS